MTIQDFDGLFAVNVGGRISDATPFETGVRETALAFRAALKGKR